MNTSRDKSKEKQELPLEELPSLEQLMATVPLEQLLYGTHIRLEDGEEECLVDPGQSPPATDAPEHGLTRSPETLAEPEQGRIDQSP